MFRAVDDQRVVGVNSCQGAHVPVLTEGGGDVLQELDCPAHFNDAGMSNRFEVLDVLVDVLVQAFNEAQSLDTCHGVLVARGRLLLHVADVGHVIADVLARQHAQVVDNVFPELGFAEREARFVGSLGARGHLKGGTANREMHRQDCARRNFV